MTTATTSPFDRLVHSVSRLFSFLRACLQIGHHFLSFVQQNISFSFTRISGLFSSLIRFCVCFSCARTLDDRRNIRSNRRKNDTQQILGNISSWYPFCFARLLSPPLSSMLPLAAVRCLCRVWLLRTHAASTSALFFHSVRYETILLSMTELRQFCCVHVRSSCFCRVPCALCLLAFTCIFGIIHALILLFRRRRLCRLRGWPKIRNFSARRLRVCSFANLRSPHYAHKCTLVSSQLCENSRFILFRSLRSLQFMCNTFLFRLSSFNLDFEFTALRPFVLLLLRLFRTFCELHASSSTRHSLIFCSFFFSSFNIHRTFRLQ